MNTTFAKMMQNPLSDEYALLQKVKMENPGFRVQTRKINTNPKKDTYKRLTYEWMRNHIATHEPKKQEYSLVQRKKFIGMKTEFQTYQSHLHCIGAGNKIAENLLRPNQKLVTSLDFNWSDNLSAIRAINSEFVGFIEREIAY